MNARTDANAAESNPAAPANGTPAKGKDLKSTLNLPQTSFPMKANLVQNEPASLKRWDSLPGGGLYALVRRDLADAPKFVFHDGPPYANGAIHLGHLMNKCLKDFVVRSKTMAGLDCAYVPGWDCHGLPIEHKVMTELLEAGKWDKLKSLTEDQRRMAVRRECQKHAEKYIKLQASQMQRLLTLADYEDPYLTMAPKFEAATLEVLAALLEQGLVYRALKPVQWSVANETALAEAELEYQDREDTSVYVDFEAADAEAVYKAFDLAEASDDDDDEDDDVGEERSKAPRPGVRPNMRPSFMIWTTTPWTLPANVGIAVNPKFQYALVFVDGNVTVMATDAIERVTQAARSEEVSVLATTTGDRLVGLRYRHPFVSALAADGLGRPDNTLRTFSVVAADYVTLEDGTGLVHTAPGHGTEDYQTGLREGLPVYCPVRADGTYDDTVPEWLRGMSIWDANKKVTEHLRASGHLFYDHVFTHSYPHDWRSKTPTIFRCTEQWFVGVDKPTKREGKTLRDLALKSTSPGGEVSFVPEWGRNRMRGMLESRPDWCISRQRAWGLPIPAFFNADGVCLMTAASVKAVAAVVRDKGSDAWFTMQPAELLAAYDAAADAEAPASFKGPGGLDGLRKGNDILDVWFESGSSWNAVMRQRNLGYPVDLYLEGSDQHRGWFQLSLLPGVGATGHAPFKTLLTHGFMVDKDGKKLSKSKGHTVEDLFQRHGADVMRWWVSTLSYENDVKVDEEFFKLAGEAYRKVRNTLRFMLSNLFDFDPAGRVAVTDFPPASPDAWVLAEFDKLAKDVAAAYDAYDFKTVSGRIYNFCNETLSAVYLAAVKDRLYCDRPDSPRRRRTQTALWNLTDGLCRLLAPITVHTADEAYRALWKADGADGARCVHLERFITAFAAAASPAWPKVVALRERATQALERAKSELGVENPLDAGLRLPDPDGELAAFDATDLADLLGVSQVHLAPAGEIQVLDLRNEPRCERSWKRDGTVRQRGDFGLLSQRDAEAVGAP